MTSPAMIAAANVYYPPGRSTADATHQYGLVFRVATATSLTQACAADIPRQCRARYWRLLVRGPDALTPVDLQWAWVLEGDTQPTLVSNQLSATGTGHTAAGVVLLDRQPEHVMCPANARRLVFIATAATGFFEAHVSGGAIQQVDR